MKDQLRVSGHKRNESNCLIKSIELIGKEYSTLIKSARINFISISESTSELNPSSESTKGDES